MMRLFWRALFEAGTWLLCRAIDHGGEPVASGRFEDLEVVECDGFNQLLFKE